MMTTTYHSDDVIYRELINDMRWSYSRISCFENCPYSWFLHYIRHEQDEPRFYSSYGSFIHKLLAQYYNGQLKKEELPTRFLSDFKEEVCGERPNASVVSNYITQGLDYLNYFNDFPYEKMSVEEKLYYDIEEIPFVGIIDYLGKENGEFFIIDNKSAGLKPKSNKKNPTDNDLKLKKMARQLYLYSAAVNQKYGKFPKALCFNCFRTGQFIKLDFDKEKYDETIKWALQTIEEIQETSIFHPKIDYFKCKYLCGLSDECCYWQGK